MAMDIQFGNSDDDDDELNAQASFDWVGRRDIRLMDGWVDGRMSGWVFAVNEWKKRHTRVWRSDVPDVWARPLTYMNICQTDSDPRDILGGMYIADLHFYRGCSFLHSGNIQLSEIMMTTPKLYTQMRGLGVNF